jgi:hypothetical protein
METTGKVTVASSLSWPVYDVNRARAEITVLELLTCGVSPLPGPPRDQAVFLRR